MSSFIVSNAKRIPTVGGGKKGKDGTGSGVTPLFPASSSLSMVSAVPTAMSGVLQSLKDVKITHDKHRITLTGLTPAVEEIVEVETSKRPTFDVVLVLDVSGSMSGEPSREMLSAVLKIVGILEETDGLSIIKFSSETEIVVPLSLMKNIKVAEKLAPHLERGAFRCGGGTKLWDSMAIGLEALTKRARGSKHPAPSHPHLVVITDGDDVCSAAQSAESIGEILRQPGDFAKSLNKPGPTFAHFHCSLISVGRPQEAHVQRFASMANRPNLHHYTANSAAEISACFRQVQEKILMIRTTQQEVSMEVRRVQTARPVTAAARDGGVTAKAAGHGRKPKLLGRTA